MLTLAASIAAAVPADAQIVPLSAPELVAGADLIARVRVVDTRAERVQTVDGAAIVTFVTFSADRTLKGAPRRVFMLEFLGGRVDEDSFEVFGLPSFDLGDRAVLFLNTGDNLISPVVGFMQGHFPIKPDDAGARDTVLRYDGTPLTGLDRVGRVDPNIASAVPVPTMSLDAFEAGITALVRAEGEAR